jgi:hypothetical protein
MDLKSLVGQTFHENQIFEQLQFDIEESFESYKEKFYLLYYEPLTEGHLKITEFQEFDSDEEFTAALKRDVRKRAWLEIYDNYGHIDLQLNRLNTSGKRSVVRKTHTRFEEVPGWSFAESDPNRPKLTPDEIRQAFQELMGLFDTQEQMNQSKTKIPV